MRDEVVPPPTRSRSVDLTLQQITLISQGVRLTWFTLLGFLGFSGVALLGVEDADFFAWGRSTQLPLAASASRLAACS